MSTADTEFRASAKEAAQATHMLAALRLAELASDPETDVDALVKIYNSTKDVAGAVPEKKIDPNAGLRTFSITFVNGSMKAVVQLPVADDPNTIEMEPTEDDQSDDASPTLTASGLKGLLPSKSMLDNYSINADLSGLASNPDDSTPGPDTAPDTAGTTPA